MADPWAPYGKNRKGFGVGEVLYLGVTGHKRESCGSLAKFLLCGKIGLGFGGIYAKMSVSIWNGPPDGVEPQLLPPGEGLFEEA